MSPDEARQLPQVGLAGFGWIVVQLTRLLTTDT